MKKLIVAAVVLIVIAVLLLNPSIEANWALSWVSANAKDPQAPEVLYRAARWCDLLGDSGMANNLYTQLHEQYPERADLCAPALYYLAYDMANGSYVVGLKKGALPYLQEMMSEYPAQQEWQSKAKKLYDELTHLR